jgi:uncharacterized radical SAM superfamily Fe-S cluster-containing enzyme
MPTSPRYQEEVVVSQKACCANTLTPDHFCGNGSLLERNLKSKCNICQELVSAETWKSQDDPPRVYMRKYCPEHGITSSCISSDARFYFVKEAGEANCCAPGGSCGTTLGENAKTAEQLHTCTLVVEIVRDCNMSCNTCYADSPRHSKGGTPDALSLDVLKSQILPVFEKQRERKQTEKIDIIQLSGGEPTLHPDFFNIISWLAKEERVADILLNTNGINLGNPLFMKQLAEVAPKGRFSVYLQFDGTEEAGQKELRKGDFRSVRGKALAACRKYDIPVALVMTVSHDNKFDCATALDKAFDDDNIRWVVYQPEFIAGRNDKDKLLEKPINVADVIHSVARGGVMDLDSWMPLPCSDPNCGMVGFLVRRDGVWQSASKFADMNKFVPFIANRMNFDTDNSVDVCGCDNFNLEEELKALGIARKDLLMVFIKPFMDARTYCTKRVESCCTHVLNEQGEIDSFCRHYGLKKVL